MVRGQGPREGRVRHRLEHQGGKKGRRRRPRRARRPRGQRRMELDVGSVRSRARVSRGEIRRRRRRDETSRENASASHRALQRPQEQGHLAIFGSRHARHSGPARGPGAERKATRRRHRAAAEKATRRRSTRDGRQEEGQEESWSVRRQEGQAMSVRVVDRPVCPVAVLAASTLPESLEARARCLVLPRPARPPSTARCLGPTSRGSTDHGGFYVVSE
mmetsp:Transcript_1121/g.3325  ORF Transcript_1121/g.3325 Transcript_1121/m.3325 type:complete len:218 (-) Transcript_1121:24-677(-)